LIESFKSTLDETRESDLLIHVVDISHPQFEDHYRVVNETLQEIGSGDKPTIVVFNKIDAFTYTPKPADDLSEATTINWSLDDWRKTWMARLEGQNVLFISAIRKDGMDQLRSILYKRVRNIHMERYPYTPTPYWDESQWEEAEDRASEKE